MSNTHPHERAETLQFTDLLVILVRHRMLVMIITSSMTLVAIGTAIVIPSIYSSKATIMPPQQQSSSVSAMLSQIGGLAGAAGSIAGLKNPNDLYVGMLQSRTVSDALIARFKLKERYGANTMDDARKTFERKRRVFSGKDGMISIDVDDKDAQFAANLANAHVDQLTMLTQTFAITEASQRRLFFEKQFKGARTDLTNAESALQHLQEATGMLHLGGQVESTIATTGRLRGAIAAKEVVAASMRTFATGQNPELLKVNEEIRTLRAQLTAMESGVKSDDFMVPAGKIPKVGIEYVRKLRDVKFFEAVYELIGKQYELARIDEAKESSNIQQLDIAIAADQESSARRKWLPALGLFLGLALGIGAALAREYVSRMAAAGTLARLRLSIAGAKNA